MQMKSEFSLCLIDRISHQTWRKWFLAIWFFSSSRLNSIHWRIKSKSNSNKWLQLVKIYSTKVFCHGKQTKTSRSRLRTFKVKLISMKSSIISIKSEFSKGKKKLRFLHAFCRFMINIIQSQVINLPTQVLEKVTAKDFHQDSNAHWPT